MQRVIGLGGPFIKASDPEELAAWYEKHLGILFNGNTYTDWQFTHTDESKKKGYNVLSFFKSDSDYFDPSEKQVMVNFIVKDLFGLIKVLREEGLTIAGPSMKSMENLVRFSTRKGIKLNCGNRQNDEKKFGKKFHTLIFALPIKKGV